MQKNPWPDRLGYLTFITFRSSFLNLYPLSPSWGQTSYLPFSESWGAPAYPSFKMVITTAYYKARNVIALLVSYTAGRINEEKSNRRMAEEGSRLQWHESRIYTVWEQGIGFRSGPMRLVVWKTQRGDRMMGS